MCKKMDLFAHQLFNQSLTENKIFINTKVLFKKKLNTAWKVMQLFQNYGQDKISVMFISSSWGWRWACLSSSWGWSEHVCRIIMKLEVSTPVAPSWSLRLSCLSHHEVGYEHVYLIMRLEVSMFISLWGWRSACLSQHEVRDEHIYLIIMRLEINLYLIHLQ